MSDSRIRREIALRAAQLMYTRDEREYFQAKRKAARLVTGSDHPSDLPSNAEIREHVQLLADMLEGESRQRDLTRMRLVALRFLRLLRRYKPRLIGSVLTGHIRTGSDIDLHVFCDSPAIVEDLIQQEGFETTHQQKRIVKAGEERFYHHVRVLAEHEIELTIYPSGKHNFPFRSSITGKPIERASEEELIALLQRENPAIDIESELASLDDTASPLEGEDWDLYLSLLKPLEKAKQNPKFHPEGDALYHSLQVFELALQERSFDIEFLLAALLHDVGKGVDPHDHVASGLEALEGSITPRTRWLIEHHMEAHQYRDGSLGGRAKRRLAEHPDLEDLLFLSELDQAGRERGVTVRSPEEALEAIRKIAEELE
jgi:predicted nucleotidyltransferase